MINEVLLAYYIGLIIFLINFPILMSINRKSKEVKQQIVRTNKLLLRLKLRGRF